MCLLLFATSCRKDELDKLRSDVMSLQEQLDQANSANKLLTLKILLSEEALNDNLIENVNGDATIGFIIDFENEESLIIEPGLVENVIFEVENWKSTFKFSDGSVHTYTSIGSLVVPDSSLLVNPNGSTPIAALLQFSTVIAGKIKIVVKGRNGSLSDVTKEFSMVSTEHKVPILGLYPSYNNTVDVFLLKEDGTERAQTSLYIYTGSLPDGLPSSIIVDIHKDEKMGKGMTLISYLGKNPSTPFFIDNYGDIRWVLDFSNNIELKNLSFDNGIEQLANGNLYFGDKTLSKIYEIDILGKIINIIPLEGYTFHHNVQEKPDGNFLVTVNKLGSTHLNGHKTIEDYIIELDRKSGAVLHEWDLKQSLDEFRITLIDNLANDPVDWFHGNAVVFDSNDNTIIVSGRTQGVVKLDYDNNVKWILAPHKEWGLNRNGENLNQFLLTPLDGSGNPISDLSILDGTTNHPDFEWSWYQHAPLVKPDGHIMLFDNGYNRNYTGTQLYSRAVEYQIDETNMTIQQVWEYGKERGTGAYSRIVSDVDFLTHVNNVLFNPGFQVNNLDAFGGKVIEVNYLTGEVVYEVRINSSGVTLHRAERMSIYP